MTVRRAPPSHPASRWSGRTTLPAARLIRALRAGAWQGVAPVVDWWLPRTCGLCDLRLTAAERGLCAGCLEDLAGRSAARCPVCALVLTGEPCGACREQVQAFDRTFVLADYAAPLDRALIAAKFHGRWPVLGQLADALGTDLRRRVSIEPADTPSLLIPVPLSLERLCERGYNQAARIAAGLSRQFGWSLATTRLHRVRATAAQSVLNRMDREANLRDAFACRTRLDGQVVGLVDDVMTTGATLHTAATVLKAAGARRVVCFAIARTPAPRIPARTA